MDHVNPFRILAIALSTRGFGYAVLEGGNSLIAYGRKTVEDDKNTRSLALIEKMIVRYLPDALALYKVNAKGVHRRPRVKELHKEVMGLAKQRKLKTFSISAIDAHQMLLGYPKGTKHQAAELMAKRFPEELAMRLPPKRKQWQSEDGRMDMFEATALAVAVSGH